MTDEQLQAIVNYIRGAGIGEAESYLATFECNAFRAGAEAMKKSARQAAHDWQYRTDGTSVYELIERLPLPEPKP